MAARRFIQVTTSAEELAALGAVVERNLADAKVEAISHDTRFLTPVEERLESRFPGVWR